MVSWEKSSLFSTPLGQTKFPGVPNVLFNNVVLLINFPDNLNHASNSNIRKVIKFCNLGDKTFETKFKYFVNDILVNDHLLHVCILGVSKQQHKIAESFLSLLGYLRRELQYFLSLSFLESCCFL